jgi:hypothetical protein
LLTAASLALFVAEKAVLASTRAAQKLRSTRVLARKLHPLENFGPQELWRLKPIKNFGPSPLRTKKRAFCVPRLPLSRHKKPTPCPGGNLAHTSVIRVSLIFQSNNAI